MCVICICISLMTNDVEYFHVLKCHPYIFFDELFVQIFYPLRNSKNFKNSFT